MGGADESYTLLNATTYPVADPWLEFIVSRSAYDISVREAIQRPATGIVVALILLGAALAISAPYLWPSHNRGNFKKAFFSDDDGKTYFVDSVYKLAPFDHDGKTANRAVVYSDGSGTFVAYLMRLTPVAKQHLQDVLDANRDEPYKMLDAMASPDISLRGTEVKVPGPGNRWVPRSDLASLEIKAPSGGPPEELVSP